MVLLLHRRELESFEELQSLLFIRILTITEEGTHSRILY